MRTEKIHTSSTLKPYEQLSAGIAIVRKNERALSNLMRRGMLILTIEDKDGDSKGLLQTSRSRILIIRSYTLWAEERKEVRMNSVFKDFMIGGTHTFSEGDRLKNATSQKAINIQSSAKEKWVDMGIDNRIPVESIERCLLLATDGLVPLSDPYSKKSLLLKKDREMVPGDY